MRNSKILKSVLLLSGLIAFVVGCAILFAPVTFYASYGIELGHDASQMNEIRAPGGALLVMGLVMLAGIFIESFAFTSIVTAAALYLSYGLSRLLSMAVDGLPDGSLVAATALELVIGTVSLLALQRYRTTAHTRRVA